MHEEANIVLQVAVAIVAATAFAFVARLLRQPLILGYIAAGIVIGPAEGFGLITTGAIEPISELGLILLLFMIGLEIDLKKLRGAGATVLLPGLVQFPAGVLLGILVAPLLGFHRATGSFAPLYLAVAAALSSTMIVVKLLYDKHELDTLPGQVTLGVLVLQDIWAILFLAVQPDLSNPAPLLIVASLAKGVSLVGSALVVSRFALPVLFRFMAKIPELLLIGALAWCFLVAMVAARLGLSLEMGALIAGISLSTFPYNLDVIAKIISLRDFFITLFFVTLGTKVPRPTGAVVGAALGLSAFLVASRFLTITPLLYKLRRGNRASVLPALNLSQVSEFSLVICSIGVGLGHIDERVLAVVVFALVLTSVLSTYAIQYNHEIFTWMNPGLQAVGMRDLDEHTGEIPIAIPPKPVVFVGFWRHASSVLHDLLERDPALAASVSVIDFNPQVHDELSRRGIANLYGDVSHPDTLQHAHVGGATVLVSTIPDNVLRGTSNLRLLRQLRRLAPRSRIIVTSDVMADALELYREGATFVYVPRLMASRELAEVIVDCKEGDPAGHRDAWIAALRGRSEVLA